MESRVMSRDAQLLEAVVAELRGLREDLRSGLESIAEQSNGRAHEASAPVNAADRLLSATRVAEILGLNVRTLRDRRHSGGFPAPIMIGRSPRWKRAAIDAWLAKRGAHR
jgi:excisionase family DNA binding protein